MKISTLIIDDEPLARSMIAQLLRPRTEFEIIGECGTGRGAIQMINKFNPDLIEFEIIGECGTGRGAIQMINKFNPDLIFLDIQLKDMTGFDVLEEISVSFPVVIFATAFDTFSLKAFDYFAFDYLLKPFNEDRFYKSINKVIENFKSSDANYLQQKIQSLLEYMQPKSEIGLKAPKTIPVPLKNRTTFVNVEDIIYITASNSYIEIFTKGNKFVLRNSISNIITELSDQQFFRIHRSTIINLDFINELINSNYGEIDVRMKDMKQFRVSKSYKKEFLTQIGLRK